MHTVEELKRQYEAAKSVTATARRKEEAALTRLSEAIIAEKMDEGRARGFEYGKTRVRINGKEYIVTGVDMKRYTLKGEYTFARVKKDGTPAKIAAYVRYYKEHEIEVVG